MTGTDFLALLIENLKGFNDSSKIIRYIFDINDISIKSRYDAVKAIESFICISSDRISKASDEAEIIMEECSEKGIRIISFFNPDYPPLLREIYSPPAVLYVKGKLPSSDYPSLAVVGTRDASRKTLAAAYETAFFLAQNSINILSGLASGIDSKAHSGAVAAGGATAAVLGSGLDKIYPHVNIQLSEEIISAGGSLISEYRPGTEALKYHFPQRNRIISGISRGTLVIHAPEKSGSLITASFALDQGRDVFVHSAGLKTDSGRGGFQLCENGAPVVDGGEDILKEWMIDYKKQQNRAEYHLDNTIYNVKENNFNRTIEENKGLYYRRKMYA